MVDTEKTESKDSGCLMVFGLVSLMFLIAYCSSQSDSTNPATSPLTDPVTVAEAREKPVTPLSASAIDIGLQHFRKVGSTGVEGGAYTYSVNCYASLNKKFEWATLDRCGAFDQLAVRTAASDDSYFAGDEVAYFDSEAVAERYLSTATKAGLVSDDADNRLDALQTRAGKLKLSARKKAEATAPPINEDKSDKLDTNVIDSQATIDPSWNDLSADPNKERDE